MVKTYKSFKIFFDNLALMHTVANKQTMFFGYMLSRMNDDNHVSMTIYHRKLAMEQIGSTAKKPLNMARQYLHLLVKANLIVCLGGSEYMVNPKFAGTFQDHKWVVDKKEALYMNAIAKSDGTMKIEVGVKDE